MKKNQSSITAMGIAFARAFESSKPAGERVCYDPLAHHFISRAFYLFCKFWVVTGYSERRGPGVIGFLVARTRYMDDYLQFCIDDGLEQLVILGAGYDSRAYRFEGLKGRVKVFEVDHPATQRAKIAKLEHIFGQLTDHVVYVPIDFTLESLAERLYASGYDRQLKTLFIWEGVTEYLTAEAVDGTLAFIAQNSGPGSSIIFDYVYAAVIEGTWKRGEATSVQRYRNITGEGWNFGIERGAVEEFLRRRGFAHVQDADSEFLKTAYFTGINQQRTVAPVYAIVHATVEPQGSARCVVEESR